MKISDAEKIMAEPTGNHVEKIYIPSLGREVLFRPLSTADVKTLARMNYVDSFDITLEGLKLSLFDKLCAEDLSDTAVKAEDGTILYPALNAKTITQIDYLSFLIGIKQMFSTDISYTFTCVGCSKKFDHILHLEKEFAPFIENFKRRTEFFEKIDERTGHIWKFELTNFQMVDYLYFKYFMEKLKEDDKDSIEVFFEDQFVFPILYIKNIWMDDEPIEDWQNISIPEKLTFWNKLPPMVTINNQTDNKNDSLVNYIHSTFDEQALRKHVMNIEITCPHCKKTYKGVYELDNFFIF